MSDQAPEPGYTKALDALSWARTALTDTDAIPDEMVIPDYVVPGISPAPFVSYAPLAVDKIDEAIEVLYDEDRPLTRLARLLYEAIEENLAAKGMSDSETIILLDQGFDQIDLVLEVIEAVEADD